LPESYAFTVRLTTIEDEARIGELLQASYPTLMCASHDAAVLDAALPFMTRANPVLLSSGTYYLAQNDEGLAVGCGGWSRERPGSGEVAPELAHIRHFATHPAWIGRGVGRALYARCEDDARAAGIRRFECNASLNGEVFYAALGFAPVRPIELAMGSVMVPAILMQRSI
jgi:GNAT superfamily N-acetyltransferase